MTIGQGREVGTWHIRIAGIWEVNLSALGEELPHIDTPERGEDEQFLGRT